MLIIGKVLKPHGIKGELKVKSYMDSAEKFKEIKEIFINNKNFTVEGIKIGGDFVIIKIKGINRIEEAEEFRNLEIKISRKNAPRLPEGRYYIADLLQCEVFIDTQRLGVLIDILQYGSADVYSIKGEKNIMFPLVDNVIKKININEKKIVLNEEEFKKVAVYED